MTDTTMLIAAAQSDAAVLEARCADLQARCKRLEKVLEFYADPETWRPPRTGWSEAGNDKGYKASEVLNAEKAAPAGEG